MTRRELNRIAQAATAMPDLTVDLGALTMRDVEVIVDALAGQARAYGRHPRAERSIVLARTLIGRAVEAERAARAEQAAPEVEVAS